MTQLLGYPEANVSAVTSKKLGMYLWYLPEDLVTMALFDLWISAETKKLMLAAMDKPAPDHSPKHPHVDPSAFSDQQGLDQFCIANSKTIFRLLKLLMTFITKDPSEWSDDETYNQSLSVVKGLAVTNDTER